MNCAWTQLLAILPPRIRREADALGRNDCQEIRLREGSPPEFRLKGRDLWVEGEVTTEELNFVVNTASRYSPWSAASVSKGYITAPGGHRIGLCGDAVWTGGKLEGIRRVKSLCIRVARDYEGISEALGWISGSVLILGAPGWGKTTMLRDLIRRVSEQKYTCVVDERDELFPMDFQRGMRTDVLTGCPKSVGIEMVLRTMGPQCIAVDEITAEQDCSALLQAANCGVMLLATVHAASVQDLTQRPLYRTLLENKVFSTFVLLSQDQSFRIERVKL